MINLWGTGYAIGVQSYTAYFRSDYNFAFYEGGSHSDTELDPGSSGTLRMVIQEATGNVGIGTSDPGSKLDVAGEIKSAVNPMIVAAARVRSAGTGAKVRGGSVSRTSTGRYTFTFSSARSDSNYIVTCTVHESSSSRDDLMCGISSTSTTSFTYHITEQDNSGSAGVLTDKEHSVTVVDW